MARKLNLDPALTEEAFVLHCEATGGALAEVCDAYQKGEISPDDALAISFLRSAREWFDYEEPDIDFPTADMPIMPSQSEITEAVPF